MGAKIVQRPKIDLTLFMGSQKLFPVDTWEEAGVWEDARLDLRMDDQAWRQGKPDYWAGRHAEARAHFEKAAERGCSRSAAYLAIMQKAGEGGYKDWEGANANIQVAMDEHGHNLLACATEDKDPDAQWCLGMMHEMGFGVMYSPADAFAFFRQAAEGGHVDAMECTAQALSTGHGVARNEVAHPLAESIRWRTKAAEQDHVRAIINLGKFYGKHALSKAYYSEQESRKWLAVARDKFTTQADRQKWQAGLHCVDYNY